MWLGGDERTPKIIINLNYSKHHYVNEQLTPLPEASQVIISNPSWAVLFCMRNAASREEHLVGGIKRAPLLVALTQLSVEMVKVAHNVVAGRRWVDRLPMVLASFLDQRT